MTATMLGVEGFFFSFFLCSECVRRTALFAVFSVCFVYRRAEHL